MAAAQTGRISVGYVVESLGSGGAERQLVGLIKYLDRSRFAVKVMTYFSGDFFRSDLEELGVGVRHVQRVTRLDPRPVLMIAGWLRSGEVDIIHSYLYTSNFYAVLGRNLARRGKVIVTERAYMTQEHGLVRLHGPWSIRRADLAVANSDAARRNLVARLDLPESQVLFVPNALDMRRFSPAEAGERQALRRRLGWGEEERVLLTVASFKEQKNHLGLIEAIADLSPSGRALRFCWVGAPLPAENFRHLMQRARDLGVSQSIELMGERADVAGLYRACDAVVLPSLWEGMSNVVLEAAACGCPVLATDVSDTRRYVLPTRTGWLVPPGDTKALRDAIEEFGQEPQARLREMGSAGRAHLSGLEMSPERLARRHEVIYETLCNTKEHGVPR